MVTGRSPSFVSARLLGLFRSDGGRRRIDAADAQPSWSGYRHPHHGWAADTDHWQLTTDDYLMSLLRRAFETASDLVWT